MKKISMTIKLGREPLVKHHALKARLTEIAGLVVYPSVEWDCEEDRPIVLRKNWTIGQYPTGYAVFSGIPNEQEARNIITKHLSTFNWVGLQVKDIHASNNPEEMRVMRNKVQAEIDRIKSEKI